MRQIAFILLIATALLEGSIFSFPLTLSLAISIAMNWPTYSASWLFVAGIILDMFTPRLWGLSSIFFLGMLLFIVRIQRKISGKGLLFIAFFILFVQSVYSILFAGGFDYRFVSGGTIMGVLFTVLFARFAVSEADSSHLTD